MTVARSHISDNVMQLNLYFHFHSWLDYLAFSMYMSIIYEKQQKNIWKEAVRPSELLRMNEKGRAISKTYKVCENNHDDTPANTETTLKSCITKCLHASVLANLGTLQSLTGHLPKFHVSFNRCLGSHRNLKNKNKEYHNNLAKNK